MTRATCNHCKHSWTFDGSEKTCPNCGEEPETKPGGGGKRNRGHHRGRRTIGGVERNFPNRWEANYCRYLHWLAEHDEIAGYEYQPAYFTFPIEHGITRYRPDFFVIAFGCDGDYYVEIKGYMDAASKTKMNRMKKYYPDITVKVVTNSDMAKLNRTVGHLIEGWEK